MSPSVSPDESARIARANHLYWETETGVNGIADDLGVSKSTLYEWVRPRWTGEDCPRCGSPLVWENRTARDQGETTCPSCDGTDEPIGRETTYAGPSARAAGAAAEPAHSGRAAVTDGPGGAAARPTPVDRGPDPQRLLIAVASGLAIGLAAGLLLRTRRSS